MTITLCSRSLHAGEFHYGSGTDRESDWPFLAPDSVLVTFNYRLGSFGFLASEDLRARSPRGGTGNYGMHDQRLVLLWVRRSIGAFGGDASNVILWGESSGGTGVAYHLVSPQSHGLFHKAIMQSPGLTQVKTLADAELNYQYTIAALHSVGSPRCKRSDGYVSFFETLMLGKRLGGGRIEDGWNSSRAEAACDADFRCAGFTRDSEYVLRAAHKDDGSFASINDLRASGGCTSCFTSLKAARAGEDGVQCLLAANASTLVNVTEYVPRDDSFETDGWAPVVDGQALKSSILDRIEDGRIAPHVDVLLGSNLDEGTIFMYLTPPLPCAANATDLADWANAFYGDALGPAVTAVYQPPNLTQPLPKCASKVQYTTIRGSRNESDSAETPRLGAMVEQSLGASATIGEYYMAAMRSAGDFAITCRVRQMARALAHRGHAAFQYFFTATPAFSLNYHNISQLGAFHGAEVPFAFGDAFELSTPAERMLSETMGCFWRNFAWSGDPNVGPGGPCGAPNASAWPYFARSADAEATMVLGLEGTHVQHGLKRQMCDAFAPTTTGMRMTQV